MTKYKAKPVVKTFPDGSSIRFDSMAEAAYWEKLTLDGVDFTFHPADHFSLEDGVTYRPDFKNHTHGRYEETKGGYINKRTGKRTTSESPEWKRKKKALRRLYPNLLLLLIYGRATKLRGWVTEWTEWLNEPQSTT